MYERPNFHVQRKQIVARSASIHYAVTGILLALLLGCSGTPPNDKADVPACFALGNYKIDRKMQVTLYGEVGVKATLADCPVEDVGVQFMDPDGERKFHRETALRKSPEDTIARYDLVFNGYVVRGGDSLSVIVSELRKMDRSPGSNQ